MAARRTLTSASFLNDLSTVLPGPYLLAAIVPCEGGATGTRLERRLAAVQHQLWREYFQRERDRLLRLFGHELSNADCEAVLDRFRRRIDGIAAPVDSDDDDDERVGPALKRLRDAVSSPPPAAQ